MRSLAERLPRVVPFIILNLVLGSLVIVMLSALQTAEQAQRKAEEAEARIEVTKERAREAEQTVIRLALEKQRTADALARANEKLQRVGELPVTPSETDPPLEGAALVSHRQ